jgi:hypothetical protein
MAEPGTNDQTVQLGEETPAERAKRLTTASRDPLLALRGVLQGAIPEGAEAFLRELRRDRHEANG